MVGTAIWWTKVEAERDAAATGLPVVPVGPMFDTGEVERQKSRADTNALNHRHAKNAIGDIKAYVERLVAASSGQPSVATGYLSDIVEFIVERTKGDPTATSDINALRLELQESRRNEFNACAQLAERDALLRDNSGKLIRMAAHLISAPLFALQDLQDEDKKMTRARVDAAVDSADARLKDAAYQLRRIADALSSSAASQVKP